MSNDFDNTAMCENVADGLSEKWSSTFFESIETSNQSRNSQKENIVIEETVLARITPSTQQNEVVLEQEEHRECDHKNRDEVDIVRNEEHESDNVVPSVPITTEQVEGQTCTQVHEEDRIANDIRLNVDETSNSKDRPKTKKNKRKHRSYQQDVEHEDSALLIIFSSMEEEWKRDTSFPMLSPHCGEKEEENPGAENIVKSNGHEVEKSENEDSSSGSEAVVNPLPPNEITTGDEVVTTSQVKVTDEKRASLQENTDNKIGTELTNQTALRNIIMQRGANIDDAAILYAKSLIERNRKLKLQIEVEKKKHELKELHNETEKLKAKKEAVMSIQRDTLSAMSDVKNELSEIEANIKTEKEKQATLIEKTRVLTNSNEHCAIQAVASERFIWELNRDSTRLDAKLDHIESKWESLKNLAVRVKDILKRKAKFFKVRTKYRKIEALELYEEIDKLNIDEKFLEVENERDKKQNKGRNRI